MQLYTTQQKISIWAKHLQKSEIYKETVELFEIPLVSQTRHSNPMFLNGYYGLGMCWEEVAFTGVWDQD